MDAHEYVHYKIEFDLNEVYEPAEEEIIEMID